MAHVKSMYDAPPPLPETNVVNLVINRPEQVGRKELWEKDFTLYVDAPTGQRRSFHEHRERVLDGATALGSPVSVGGLGLEPGRGEVVGVLGDNCMDYFALCHSLLAITIPYALLSSYSTPLELTHSIQLGKVTRIFVVPRLLGLALAAAKKSGIPERNVYILDGPKKGRLSFNDLVTKVRTKKIPRLAIRPAKKDTLAYYVYSSGTSGLPKAVMISHGNLSFVLAQGVVMGQEAAKVWTAPPSENPDGHPVTLAFLPLHHTMGHVSFTFRALLVPNCLVLLPKWEINLAMRAISKYRVANLVVVPSIAHQINEYLKVHKADFSSIVTMGSGAAYLPTKLAQALKSYGRADVRFGQGYGLSECTIQAIGTTLPGLLNGHCIENPDSTGILVPGMEAKILREDGSLADINEPGELVLKGGNVALGYLANEKANRETFKDGWLHTGDRFRVDKDGYFYFEDRAKDTLKVSGMQVSPVEIEVCLLDQPDKLIVDVTVAGVSGGRTADEKVPRAWVVLSAEGKKRGKAAVVKALNAWLEENLSKYKQLRGGIGFVDQIPKSPTGKVLRRILVDRHENYLTSKAKAKL